jgi:hypothetical protein
VVYFKEEFIMELPVTEFDKIAKKIRSSIDNYKEEVKEVKLRDAILTALASKDIHWYNITESDRSNESDEYDILVNNIYVDGILTPINKVNVSNLIAEALNNRYDFEIKCVSIIFETTRKVSICMHIKDTKESTPMES